MRLQDIVIKDPEVGYKDIVYRIKNGELEDAYLRNGKYEQWEYCDATSDNDHTMIVNLIYSKYFDKLLEKIKYE